MEAKDRIIVALDVPTLKEATDLAEQLKDVVGGFKVGLELIHSETGGSAVTRAIQTRVGRRRVFYDCKLNDIPHSVVRAIRNIIPLEVMMLNVHCLGGFEMLKASRKAAEEEAKRIGVGRPLVLGVTILTSLDYFDLVNMQFHVSKYYDKYYLEGSSGKQAKVYAVAEIAIELAKLAQKAGLDGVVASPQEVMSIRRACGKNFHIVTPGIRASDAPADDQKRTATATEAIAAGADYLVIGRPITQAPDPIATARQIAQEITPVVSGRRIAQVIEKALPRP